MSDEKLYSEREVRKRERAAFCCGAWWQAGQEDSGLLVRDHMESETRRRYPITRKVPRVIRLTNDVEVKQLNGDTYSRRPGYVDWVRCTEAGHPDNIRRLADLLANPYEEVAE